MRKLILILGIVGLMAASPSPSRAIEAGGVVAWHDDFDLGIGGRVSFPVEAISEKVTGVGEFLFFFPDDGGISNFDLTYWEINGNLKHEFVTESSSFAPYAGVGLNIARVSSSFDAPDGSIFQNDFSVSNTEVGINLLGGASLKKQKFNPFVEAKIELNGGDGFVISFGASMPIGGDN